MPFHYSHLYRKAKEYGYSFNNKKRKYSEDVDQFILDNYGKLLNIDITDKTGASDWYIQKVLKENNISQKGKGKNNFFDVTVFDSNNGQYILGYLMGDGSVVYNSDLRTYWVEVKSIDEETVNHFKDFFKESCKISRPKDRDIFEITISNKKLCEYLISIGITPKKAKTCKYLCDYNSDFLRGYFDADGFVSKNGCDSKITSMSHDSLSDVKNFLGFGTITKRKGSDCFDIYFSSSAKCKKLYEIMYQNEGYYLSRKKKKFENNV